MREKIFITLIVICVIIKVSTAQVYLTDSNELYSRIENFKGNWFFFLTTRDCYKCTQNIIPASLYLERKNVKDSNIILITDHYQNAVALCKDLKRKYKIIADKSLVSSVCSDGRSKVGFKNNNQLYCHSLSVQGVDSILINKNSIISFPKLTEPIYDSVLSLNDYFIITSEFGFQLFDKVTQQFLVNRGENTFNKRRPVFSDSSLFLSLPFRVKPQYKLISYCNSKEVLDAVNLDDLHIESVSLILNQIYIFFTIQRAFLNTTDTSEVSVVSSNFLATKQILSEDDFNTINDLSKGYQYLYLDTIKVDNLCLAPSIYFGQKKYCDSNSVYLPMKRVVNSSIDNSDLYLAKINNRDGLSVKKVVSIGNTHASLVNAIFNTHIDSVDCIYLNSVHYIPTKGEYLWITRRSIQALEAANQITYLKLSLLQQFFTFNSQLFSLEKEIIDKDLDIGRVRIKAIQVD